MGEGNGDEVERKKKERLISTCRVACALTYMILQTWEIGEKPASGNSEPELHVCISNFQFYQYTKVNSTTLKYIPVHYSTLQHIPVHYSTLQHIPVHYSTLQHIPVHYSTPQYIPVH